MLDSNRFYQIGQVLKSNGTDGQVVISLSGLDAADISEKEPVFIFFDELPVPYFISDPVRRGSNKILCYLTDTSTLEDAEELAGRGIFMIDEDADDASLDFTGWTLNGIHTIEGIEDIPGNPCLILEGGVLVPLHEDLVEEIDEASRSIRMNLPDGLL